MHFCRRTLLKGLAFAGLPLHAFADVASKPADTGEFFVFIHAAGGWDVTLWADPRNEKKGIVQPATSENTDTSQLRHWVDAPFDEGVRTFQLVRAKSGAIFGPGIGGLLELSDRITVVNGLAMNTVSHPDGSTFSATGRHQIGGRSVAPSIDTMIANELGKDQLFPVVSVQFPSAYVGNNLDRRVVPLSVGQIGSVSRSLTRTKLYDSDEDRDAVTALLSEEAHDLAKRSVYPDVAKGLGLQMNALRRMLDSRLQDAFSADRLRKAQPAFNYKARFQAGTSVNAAFALEAMKRNVVRCVSFAMGGFDTHGNNYKNHALLLQETLDLVATLIKQMDATPHPTKSGAKLSDHAHILVVSEFCRTPQINMAGGRDHYPNNSALVVSPRFKGGLVYGKSDPEQLLPAKVRRFVDGERAIAPPDLLATLLSAFKIDPRKYMRDGESVKELLRA